MGMAKGGVKIHIKGDKTTKRNCNNSFMKVSTTREFANHQKYWQTIKDFVMGSQAPGQRPYNIGRMSFMETKQA